MDGRQGDNEAVLIWKKCMAPRLRCEGQTMLWRFGYAFARTPSHIWSSVFCTLSWLVKYFSTHCVASYRIKSKSNLLLLQTLIISSSIKCFSFYKGCSILFLVISIGMDTFNLAFSTFKLISSSANMLSQLPWLQWTHWRWMDVKMDVTSLRSRKAKSASLTKMLPLP